VIEFVGGKIGSEDFFTAHNEFNVSMPMSSCFEFVITQKSSDWRGVVEAVRALRECPHLRVEIWGTQVCGFNLNVG
jgi:hypothetical protein